MISNQDNIVKDINPEGFDIRKMINPYLKQWKWFVASLLLSLGLAFINLRYTTPQYAAMAEIMIIEEADKASGANALNDLSIFSKNKEAALEDEILVMTSREIMKTIVEKLDLNIQYFTQGRVLKTELYNNLPIEVNFLTSDSIINKTKSSFFIDIVSNEEFLYRINEKDTPKKFRFGKNVSTDFGGIIVTPTTKNIDDIIGDIFQIKIVPVVEVASSIRNRISISPSRKDSKVLALYLQDPVQEKAKDIINVLIETYNETTIKNKHIKSNATVDFIDERVELIADDLVNVENSIVRFKTGNKITDGASEAVQFSSSRVLNEQELGNAKTQLRQLNYMESSLGDKNAFNAIPGNIGMGDPSMNSISSKYNELIAKREKLLKSAGAKNTIVLQLDETLLGLKQSLNNNIKNSKKSLGITISSLENQSSKISSKISSVPGQQSKLHSIERKQGIKESLYLYLLEKREEAAISSTTISSNVKIIDDAYDIGGQVSPNKRVIYMGALFLGLLIPFGIIYVLSLMDNKIHNKEDLNREVKDITILGEIPQVKGKKNNILIEKNDRSILSESFRIIRTNFDFVRRGRNNEDKEYNNIVFVTSTINGEGKSFFTMNMALTLANSNKKVLLIGADIRNPQTHSFLKDQKNNQISKTGLTEFLSDKSIEVEEVINTYNINENNIDIMFSGEIPPNPAELLMSDKMKILFDTVSKQYDYVIVDTAPAMLVTDTLLINQYAGHTIYITRAGYTEKRILNFAKDLHANNKLNGMMLVVNDVKQSNFGYGARYGYYGTSEKKGWFSKNA